MNEQIPPEVGQRVGHVGSDRPLTRAESDHLELAVQQAALTAWRIHHDDRRNRWRLVRWALWCRLRAVI